MKKAIPVVIFIIFIGVIGYIVLGPKEQVEEAGPVQPREGIVVTEPQSLIAWLKDGKGVECIMSTAEGSITVQAKDKKVRIDGIPYMFSETSEEQSEAGSSLTTEDDIYMWSGAKGVKFNISSLEEISGEEESSRPVDWEEWAKEVDDGETSYECKRKSLSDNIFSPPTDIEFTDWTEWMKGISEFGQELEESIEQDEAMDLEDLQKRLEDLNLDELTNEIGVPAE